MQRNKLLPLALVFALVSCREKALDAAGPGAVHEHHAPHGGALEVLGEEFAHVELVLDAKEGRLTGYVLDGEAEHPVRIAQSALRLALKGLAGGDTVIELKAVASPLTGETVGDTSQFEGVSEKLRGVTAFEGVLETITAKEVKFDAVPVGFPGGNEKETPDAGK